MRRAALLLAPAVAVVASARPAAADVQVQTRIPEVVEQNEPFEVRLRVTLDGGSPSARDARLPVTPGLRVGEPSLSPENRISIINGRMSQSSAVTVSWRVLSQKAGKVRIGPPSVEIAGQRVTGEARTVEVVAPGTARRPRGIPGRPPTDPFDLFDPFRGFPNFPNFPGFPFDEPDQADQVPSHPPDLTVERAPDDTAFVVTRANPKRVVVGQAIRFGVYAYGGQGVFRIETANEPSRAGFIAYPEQVEPGRYSVPIQGREFIAERVSAMLLYPVQAGTLRIGPARLGFAGRKYSPAQNTLLFRESEPIDIVVTEPPLSGRPPGYRIGDVGRYELKAFVDPRAVRQGEAVSIVATLEGTGTFPTKLSVPLQSGVEWQEPTYTEKIEAVEGSLRGQRTFSYVVRLNTAGSVALGELSLATYDPDNQRYAIARADLGRIEVTPNPALGPAKGAAENPEDRLRGALKPRHTLGAAPAASRELTDRPSFWMLLALGPLSVLTASGVRKVAARVAARLRQRRDTPAENARSELAAAREAAARGDTARTAAAVERAVHLALEAATGVKSRGVLRSELASTLAARGLSSELAETAVRLLESVEAARFVGAEGSGQELAREAEAFVRATLRGKRA